MAIAEEQAKMALLRHILGYTQEDFDKTSQSITRLITQPTTQLVTQSTTQFITQSTTQMITKSTTQLITQSTMPEIDTQKDEGTSTEVVVTSKTENAVKKALLEFIGSMVNGHMKRSGAPSPNELDFNNPYHGLAAYYDHPEHGRLYGDTDTVQNWPRNGDFTHTRSGTCTFPLRPVDELPEDIRQIKTFIAKRGGSHGAGQWALAGGHQDIGESLERCAARELKEELSIEVVDVRPVGVTSDNFLDSKKGIKNYNTNWMVCLMKDNKAEPEVPENEREKVLEVKEITLGELEQGVKNNPKEYFYCLQQLFRQYPNIIEEIAQVYAVMMYQHKFGSTT